MLMREAYGPDYDLPPPAMAPAKTVMLATIPRTGSTYCGLRMWETGVLGAPLEYLNINTNKQMFMRLSAGSQHRYWREVQRLRQTANGVFSYKMFIANYLHFKRSRPDFLRQIAPDFVVYLTREDKVGQAISYARAIQSRKWFAAVKEQNKPEYSFAAIRRQLRSIERQEQAWEGVFSVTGAEPVRITYEELLRGQDATLERVCAHVGESFDRSRTIEIGSIDRQADSLSDDWRERFERDRLTRMPPPQQHQARAAAR